jgi:D-3-phosphoglycerate dehydrogenase
MSTKVLSTHKLPEEGLRKLRESFDLIIPEGKHFSYKDLEEKVQDVEVLIPVFGFEINEQLIEKGEKLKIIANFGVGFNNIDVDAATRNNIVVTNTPKTVIEPTAELAFGLLLSLTRRITELDHKLKNREEIKWEVMANLGHTLEKKNLGIIGMGNIGKSFAQKARAFGMNVCYYSKERISLSDEHLYQVAPVSFEDLIKESDVISLHVPLTEETHHMLDSEEFSKMKEGVYIINSSRGPVINEKALIEYLKNGKLGGAGLDVYEFEPKISKELLEMENVVLTPHIGTASLETRIEMAREVSLNILGFYKGEIPPNIVNPDVL